MAVVDDNINLLPKTDTETDVKAVPDTNQCYQSVVSIGTDGIDPPIRIDQEYQLDNEEKTCGKFEENAARQINDLSELEQFKIDEQNIWA